MTKKMKTSNSYLLTKVNEEFVLTSIGLPELPSKIYGDLQGATDRILTTFKDRDRNLGVLFSGLKGNSKTVTSLNVCKEFGGKVILITEPFTGDKFKEFLYQEKEECIIFIDEFEKIYNTTELQDEFLTILDGVFGGKKLFLFTSNSSQISRYLINRPNRIYYHFKYDNIEESVLNEIIKEELKYPEFEIELRDIILILGSVSYDVILNLISEANRFKKSPKELVKELNIQVEQTNFTVVLLLNGKRFTATIEYNPLTSEYFSISYKDENGHYRYFHDSVKQYTMYPYKGSFVFENEKNKLIFTPFKPYKFIL